MSGQYIVSETLSDAKASLMSAENFSKADQVYRLQLTQ